MATYATFLAQNRRVLEEATEGVWADASLMSWTNDGFRDLCTRADVYRDEAASTNTVIGTAAYALAAYTTRVIEAYYDTRKLYRYDYADIGDLDTMTDTGTPTVYLTDQTNITLVPTPNAVKALRVFRWRYPAPITATTDTMPLASRYDHAVSYYVLARAFEQINDFDTADRYLQRYEDAVEKIRASAAIEHQGHIARSPRETY